MFCVDKEVRRIRYVLPVFVLVMSTVYVGYLFGSQTTHHDVVAYLAPPPPRKSAAILKQLLPNPNLTDPHQKPAVSPPRRKTLPYEFVVAHYNEPLEWFRPYAKEAGHVYHKGPDSGPPFEVYKWEKLPNLGRETQTYLHHIIHNYDNLADVTVFLLGHGPKPDKHACFADPMDFLQKAKKKKFCKYQGNFSKWGRIQHLDRWLKALNAGTMRRANTTLGEFYTALFGKEHPASVHLCLTSCFSATRDNLRLHPISFYQKAITFVNYHTDHEEAHYFERLWGTIINAH